ncbi:MAG: hypothetical protein FJ303_19350 [Planctomycetes bacterium]|nr:hypothetical protein [Planctomycetota bacterium]
MVSTLLFEPAPARILPTVATVSGIGLEAWTPRSAPRLESSEPPLGSVPISADDIAVTSPLVRGTPSSFAVHLPRFGDVVPHAAPAHVTLAGHEWTMPTTGSALEGRHELPALPLPGPALELLVQFGTPSSIR